MCCRRRANCRIQVEDTVLNTALCMKQEDDIDCGGIVKGSDTVDAAGERIFRLVLETASGRANKSELHGYGQNEFVPWQLGAVRWGAASRTLKEMAAPIALKGRGLGADRRCNTTAPTWIVTHFTVGFLDSPSQVARERITQVIVIAGVFCHGPKFARW